MGQLAPSFEVNMCKLKKPISPFVELRLLYLKMFKNDVLYKLSYSLLKDTEHWKVVVFNSHSIRHHNAELFHKTNNIRIKYSMRKKTVWDITIDIGGKRIVKYDYGIVESDFNYILKKLGVQKIHKKKIKDAYSKICNKIKIESEDPEEFI